MSCDFFVWYPQKQIANAEATELRLRLGDGDACALVPHSSMDAFYAEPTARHPEIDTIPEEKIGDHDYCPWSCKLDHSRSYLITSCVWSKAGYVQQLLQVLARKQGLTLYDPQSERVTYPDGSTGENAKTGMSGSAAWVLGFFALLFAGIFVYSEKVAPSRGPLILYLFAGLCALLARACFRQASR
jgi:hypothetical protein